MASRRELKEQRRREREEAERREAEQLRRRRRLRVLGGLAGLLAVGAGVATVIVASSGPEDPKKVFAAKPEGLQERVREARLTAGPQHFHPTVRVAVNGRDIPIPDDIGSDPAGGHIPIHRHPGDDQVHAEGIQEGTFSLGQFMKVWGVPLSETRLGPYEADGRRKVSVLVKPKGAKQFRESDQVEELKLKDGDEVYVVYGTGEQSPVVQ